MTYYRLNTRKNRRFACFDEFRAPDDIQACKLALDHLGNREGELFCGTRRVRLFDDVIAN
jgi:hypothetical protein